ncbi:unnamed protein product [Parascedosporium putredinis]|uniref:Flavin-binding monooxygenase n=1 Tax=Parascedosporium putredinis TaxID=1442378 RepID=A0A9P1M9L0_9PEZI|nr:unnamed protein product [Parascedosporium putredinis]CAI7991002.1 unnamed protein product [Parascedosporium putredinis]
MHIASTARNTVPTEVLDFVIIGAGISGINTAYYLQNRGPKGATYAILEGRESLGGTWALFQYPGIRSDSDINTFGFSWNPWQGDKALASAREIVSYMSDSASKAGVDQHFRFNHRVTAADWSSPLSMWTLDVVINGQEKKTIGARYVVLGTGYYDYEQPLSAVIPGIENFGGQVIHPQFWPKDYSYTNKEVVVIGSGATAITIVPSMAKDARRVTMLQRSPTYIAALPNSRDLFGHILYGILPKGVASRIVRTTFILRGYFLFTSSVAVDPHFTPTYNPWEQRLCASPDGDFFRAMRSGKAQVITDSVHDITETEIVLKSGKTLKPDAIITATGLKLHFAGHIRISVDGVEVDPATKFVLRGCMMQDVPNMAFVIGYVNASWTLGAEATATYLTRLWKSMNSKGIKAVVPTVQNPGMKSTKLLELTSTYLRNSSEVFPKAGVGIWSRGLIIW